jgi:fatty acid/phospholipid biosynthesis enzyme
MDEKTLFSKENEVECLGCRLPITDCHCDEETKAFEEALEDASRLVNNRMHEE